MTKKDRKDQAIRHVVSLYVGFGEFSGSWSKNAGKHVYLVRASLKPSAELHQIQALQTV